MRPVEVAVDHTRHRQRLRIRDRVSVRIRDRYAGGETVTCVIPGHERAGEELVAGELVSRISRSASTTAACAATARRSTTRANHVRANGCVRDRVRRFRVGRAAAASSEVRSGSGSAGRPRFRPRATPYLGPPRSRGRSIGLGRLVTRARERGSQNSRNGASGSQNDRARQWPVSKCRCITPNSSPMG